VIEAIAARVSQPIVRLWLRERSPKKMRRPDVAPPPDADKRAIELHFAKWQEDTEQLLLHHDYIAALAIAEAVQAELPPDARQQMVAARAQQGDALMGLKRWKEALPIWEELIAELEQGRAELGRHSQMRVYWARAVSLQELGRLPEAERAAAQVIKLVGTTRTTTERSHIAHAYEIQAVSAAGAGRYEAAINAFDAAIAQCAGTDDPELNRVKPILERKRQMLVTHVRFVR